MSIPTAHISSLKNDIAKTVIMPGDPLRSKMIAENFLTDVKLVNNVRGVQGYTGFYNGKKVTVMASGMGIPSIGIYSYELYNFFGVKNIIRIGSAGAMSKNIKVRDVVLGQGACTTSAYAEHYGLPGTFAPIASYELLKTAADISEELGVKYHVGNLLSSDAFYGDDGDLPESRRGTALWGKMGVMAVEMEAAGLYMNAARAGKRALAICTISDHVVTGESLCAEDRQNTFTDMMKIALETAKRIDGK